MMDIPDILPMKDRRYMMIPIEKIKVINPRIRDEEQFQMNVQSIDNNGMLMPIRVNDKFLEKTEFYELICGEGRLIAHQRLGKSEIKAEAVTCTRKEAYLQSLVENLARSRPGTMVFARELKQLHDEGWDYDRISKVSCRSPEYVRQYIGLVEKGEDRLIQGVEQGVFSISFAILVAQSDDANIQNVLMDAFDRGIVNCQNFARARRIIGARMERASRSNGTGKKNRAGLTVTMLKKDITDLTKSKDSFVREAESKENRFLTLLTAINALWRDEAFVRLVTEEQVKDRPELVGNIRYEA
jgi:ParB family chromosome partitioning protein